MKKFLVLLFLLVLGTGVYAQKSYVNVYVKSLMDQGDWQPICITGDIPNGIKSYYGQEDKMNIGTILNLLSREGYEVEFVTNNAIAGSSTRNAMNFLLSRNSSSNQTQIEGDVNRDGAVTISDVNKVINIILGIIRDNPSLLKQ